MSQKEGPEADPPQPPTTAADLWEDDVDEPVGEVTAASESVEVADNLIRTVTENARTLRFDDDVGFSEE